MTLDAQQLRRLSALLDEALDLDEAQRQAWLDALSGDDAEFAPTLRKMLAGQAAGEANDLLERRPDFTAPRQDAAVSDRHGGDVVGPYRLLRELGRGGMGEVWLAERIDGSLKRQVALKLPHSALPRRQLAERFERERDILGSLVHANIARLYDAGVTDQGQPYLALEYVDGQTLTAWCDARKLGIKARIELYRQVFAAVEYAHRQLVVHRDLKPSNILVTTDGEVRLLDFGIAKLMTDGQALETELTQLGGRALSLQYASPEQVLGQPLGTTSDVYSLGVVLYELLTGVLPYRVERQSRGAIEDAILTAEPARPSRVVGDADVAVARATSSRRLAGELAGDLETILLKALKKHPSERYATVDAFAVDLCRLLAGEPIHAQPDSIWYRTRKFAARNRWELGIAAGVVVAFALELGLGATALAMFALTVGLTAAMWQAGEARRQASLARAAAVKAQDETKTAQVVLDFLKEIFQANSSNQSDPQKARNTTARELLDIGAKRLDGAFAEAPQAKLQLFKTLGGLYVELGLNAESAQLQRKRIELARAQYGNDSIQVVEPLLDLALVLAKQLDGPNWEAALKTAEAILDRNGNSEPALRARLYSRFATFYEERDLDRARDYADKAVELFRRLPHDREYVNALAAAVEVFMQRSEWMRAKSLLEEAIAATDGKAGQPYADLAPKLYGNLGWVEFHLANLTSAVSNMRTAWERAKSLNGNDHADTLERQMDYANFLVTIGRSAEGVSQADQALETFRRVKGAQEPLRLSLVLQAYVADLAYYGRLEEAQQANLENLGILEQSGDSPRLAQSIGDEARIALELGRYEEAAQLISAAHEMRKNTGNAESEFDREDIKTRVLLLVATHRNAEAGELVDRLQSPDAGTGPLSVGGLAALSLRQLTELSSGHLESALGMARQMMARLESSPNGAIFPHYAYSSRLIAGKALRAMHQPQAALPLLEQAAIKAGQLFDSQRSPKLADAQIALAECLVDLNRRDEARVLATKAHAIQATHKELGEHYRQPLRALEARLAVNR